MQIFQHKYYLFAISILAFIGYLATGFIQSNYYNDGQVALNEKNNAWAHYSSKSIKRKIYEVERNQVLYATNIQAHLRTTLLQNIDSEINRYNTEQDNIKALAIKYDDRFNDISQKTFWLMFARTLFLFTLGLVLCLRFLVDPMSQDRFYHFPIITIAISAFFMLIGLIV